MTQLKFSENATLNLDEKKRQFINKSIEITEQYINTDEFKNILEIYFFVPLKSFEKNLSQVKVDFKELKSDKLSYIRIENVEIHLNKIFLNRYLVSSRKEQQLITFAVSMCLLYELANLAIKWTESKSFQEINRSIQNPQIYGYSVGRFLEKRLFATDSLALVVRTENRENWSENDEIIAMALDNRCKCQKHAKNRYHKITQEFFSNIYDMKMRPNMLLLFEMTKESGIEDNETAFLINHDFDDDINGDFCRSGLKQGESALPLCGIHLLFDDLINDEKTIKTDKLE